MLTDQKQFLSSLPNKPGVYQMLNDKQKVLYVGKAKDLKKRVTSYFKTAKDSKTIALMAQVVDIQVIITANENAALLLESNLIKTLKPRYNILFKDDKSFKYICLSKHDFPRLFVCRNASKEKGRLFGPFPSGKAVNSTLDLLQKIFRLRVCKDSFMRNRSRACMLNQIDLCSAPCVNKISKEVYVSQVKLVEEFLLNKSDHVVKKLNALMDKAALDLDYEQAADYRDQIANLRKVQLDQAIIKGSGSYDVIAVALDKNTVCVDLLFVRGGLLLGNRSYFPSVQKIDLSADEIISAFIMQHYLNAEAVNIIPDKILVSTKLSNVLGVAKILSEKAGRQVTISYQIRGAQKQLITMAQDNAQNALKTRLISKVDYPQRLLAFKEHFNLSKAPKSIECFDVSHTMGEAQVVSCIAFDENGSNKNRYRKFNVKTKSAGDDYAALREAIMRRYQSLENLPEIIIIDGGLGQLNVAIQVLQKLKTTPVMLMAVAKGSKRKPGLEEIYIAGQGAPQVLSPDSLALHFIQQVRDEAHRFAITGHRKKMAKSRSQSILDNIPGVGSEKRVLLLKQFGGLAELKSAGIEDLAKVKGVGPILARSIYEYLHGK